ncbi:hypothetical protein TcCL_NonESM07053 [Trypanosoma cruzi]|nr:hypothetical protein TcCL_NonESM07053 [Trypanosoma cruzi]
MNFSGDDARGNGTASAVTSFDGFGCRPLGDGDFSFSSSTSSSHFSNASRPSTTPAATTAGDGSCARVGVLRRAGCGSLPNKRITSSSVRAAMQSHEVLMSCSKI